MVVEGQNKLTLIAMNAIDTWLYFTLKRTSCSQQ